MKLDKLGDVAELLLDSKTIIKILAKRRKYRLLVLFFSQIVAAVSEVISIGAILPFLSALANANEILTQQKYRPWLDLAGINNAVDLITILAIIFAVSIALANILRILTSWIQLRTTAMIGSDISTEIYHRLLFQSYNFHTKFNSGKILNILTHDMHALMHIMKNVFMIMKQGLSIVAIIIALVIYNAQVALSMTGLLVGAYLIASRAGKGVLLRNGKVVHNKLKSKIKIIQESFGGIRDIILDNNQQTFIKIFSNNENALRLARTKCAIIGTMPRYVLEVAGVSLLCIITIILARQENNFQPIIPLVGVFSMAAIRLLPAMQSIYSSYAVMQGSHISMKRALDTLELPLDLTCIARPTSTYNIKQNISLENIWYSYSDADDKDSEQIDWVLKDINMVIPVNKAVALVGYTGGGKSTLADIILGLLRPQRGYIRIDENVLTDGDINNWRQSVAHVPQFIFLTDNTIKENIAFGMPVKQIDINRVKEVARLACIDDFIESRPLGYDEIVGERGIQLSGGQRQRIGIARALYKQTSIIVFDEATSSLDNSTEARVMEAINNLSGKITMLIIAHRLSTVRSADIIYEISNGKVVASGKYDELIKTSNTFRVMANGVSEKL